MTIPKEHWTVAYKKENARLKKELAELKALPTVKAFAEAVGNNIMIILANKPYFEWPELAKMAFQHECRKTPTSGAMYLNRLPEWPVL